MFDAKSLLEQIVNAANRPAAAASPAGGGAGQGGLADILGDLLGGGAQPGRPGTTSSGGNPLEDILRNLVPGANPQASGARPSPAGGGSNPLEDILRNLIPGASPQASPGAQAPSAGPAAGTGGGLGDILGQLQKGLAQGGSSGNLTDVLGQIFAQATAGVKEGAGHVSDATGARDVVTRTTGQTPEDLLAKLKELIANNQLGAGALGGLILGTQTGRGLAVGAAKIGALALIGGLAYKAFQNYQAGRPLIDGPHSAEAAPKGTGFEPQALTNQSATLYIRAMIAAADADGRIDSGEKERIFGALKQGGLEREAEAFLQQELHNPATVDDLAADVSSPEEGVQVYTAARIAIDPDNSSENAFLAALAKRLGIDSKLAAFIDHETRTTAA